MDAPTAPLVSVLVTTFNGARYIAECLDSVLAQSFADFELVVVDDGSTDATLGILRTLRDPRVRVLPNDGNLGVVRSRNRGFSECRGALVATLDHDDIAAPARLARQVAFLDAHPEVVLLGTQTETLRDGRRWVSEPGAESTPTVLRWMLMMGRPLTYSSLMFRAAAVRRLGSFMREATSYADDFDLCHRLAGCGEVARLPEMLTTYRVHGANTTRHVQKDMTDNAVAVLRDAHARYVGAAAETGAPLVLRHVAHGIPVADGAALDALGSYLATFLAAFVAVHRANPTELAEIGESLGQVWWRLVRGVARRGRPWLLARYRRRRGLCGPYRPGVPDVALTLAVGLLRAAGFSARGSSPDAAPAAAPAAQGE